MANIPVQVSCKRYTSVKTEMNGYKYQNSAQKNERMYTENEMQAIQNGLLSLIIKKRNRIKEYVYNRAY